MANSYKIAIAAGFLLGLIAIWASAVFVPVSVVWEIPTWDFHRIFAPGKLFELQQQAIFLRSVHILATEGIWYFIAPIGLLSLVANLHEHAKLNRQARQFEKSLAIASSCLGIFVTLWSLLAAFHDTDSPKFLTGQLIYGLECGLFITAMLLFSLFAPGFWLLIHFLVVASDAGKEKRVPNLTNSATMQ